MNSSKSLKESMIPYAKTYAQMYKVALNYESEIHKAYVGRNVVQRKTSVENRYGKIVDVTLWGDGSCIVDIEFDGCSVQSFNIEYMSDNDNIFII